MARLVETLAPGSPLFAVSHNNSIALFATDIALYALVVS